MFKTGRQQFYHSGNSLRRGKRSKKWTYWHCNDRAGVSSVLTEDEDLSWWRRRSFWIWRDKTASIRLEHSDGIQHRTSKNKSSVTKCVITTRYTPLQSSAWSPSMIWMLSTAMWPALRLSATPSTITYEQRQQSVARIDWNGRYKQSSNHTNRIFAGIFNLLTSVLIRRVMR